MRHVVIIPARNEAEFIGTTLDSLLAQTELPDRIYVVDDGSTDATAQLVMEIAQRNPSVVLLRKERRAQRRMGGGVVEAFNLAYEHCRAEEFEYVSKIDADQILPPEYFEVLLRFLDENPEYAAASGALYEWIGGELMRARMPGAHVCGSLKTVRKRVFDEMGGFIATLGWDIIDEVKIRSLGYQTTHLPELGVIHLRQHGSAEGTLKGRVQWGEGAYIIGSHPIFALLRGCYRMLEPPYFLGGLAFWWGYVRAAVTRQERIADRALIAALRREQLHRLLYLNRLPAGR